MSLSPVIDYWALLSSLNLGPAYRPSSQPWSLATHGSHIANGVELVPGAPGYQPQLAYNQWFSLLFSAPPLPLPTLSLASSAEGFALTLSVAGTVKMSVSGDLGSFVAGYTLLTAQATVKEGFLTLSANGQTSTATSQYVVLGTAGDDSIDTSAAGNRVNYIFGGAGNDTLKGGAGADVLDGGDGVDTYVLAFGDSVIGSFDTVAVTHGDIIRGAGLSVYNAVIAVTGAQVLTDLVTNADLATALAQAIGGVIANNTFLVHITDAQTTTGTDYSGYYMVSEFSSSLAAVDGMDIVVKLMGVTGTSSIAFSGNDIVVSV